MEANSLGLLWPPGCSKHMQSEFLHWHRFCRVIIEREVFVNAG